MNLGVAYAADGLDAAMSGVFDLHRAGVNVLDMLALYWRPGCLNEWCV